MSYLDEALAEVKRVTPKSGVNVCIYDDYEDVGNKLETIANFNTVEEAQKFINDYDGDAELVMYEAETLEESDGKNFMSSDKNHNIPTYLEMSLQDYISGQNRDNDDYEDTNWKKNKSNEFDEDNINRHPEGAEDGKGGQFAPKDGGIGHSFSEPKEINKEELDEDSDYRKDNPVKEDNVIHTGDPVGEEWYEKLEIGEEYSHLDQARPAFGASEYTQDVEGYNLTNVFERKIKSQYSDDRDKFVGTITKCYDDNGKLIAEQVRNDYSGVFIVSEKRLDESGEMKEIEYTDEEHQKNMRNFVPKYDDDYRGGMRAKWDKNQEKRKKSKGFDVKDGGRRYIKRDPDIKKLEDERAEIMNKYHETNDKINKLDKTKDGDEIRELQSEGDELIKESQRIGHEILRVEHSPEKDNLIEQPLKELESAMSQIFRIWNQEQEIEHGYQKYDRGAFNTLSRDELSKYTSKLDEEKKQIFEKFLRNSDKIRDGISSGKIKNIGGKFIEDGGKLDEYSLLAFSNNQIVTNNALYRAEVEEAEYGVNLTSATLLHYRNEVTNKDGYYEGDYSDDMVYVGSNIEEHYKVDEKKHIQLALDYSKAYDSGSNRKMEQAQKALKDFDDSKPEISKRERRILDDINKYKNMNKKSYGHKKEKVQMYKDRIGNEVFTPLTEKNVHIYADNSVDEETLKHMYSKAKKFFPMNKWVKSSLDVSPTANSQDIRGRNKPFTTSGRWAKSYPLHDYSENKMNLQLNSGEGKKFKVSGSSKMSEEAGNWDKEHQTINVFKANPKNIDWIWEHELSHSHYDYLEDSVGMNLVKNKIKAFNAFNEECKKLDPVLVTQLMGSYAGGYVKAFQNKEPYGQNLETEMYAGLTDLRYEKGDGKGISVASWKAYRELAKTYPDFIKTFEILSDKPIGDDYVEPVFDEDERKSFGESLVINDFEVETWEEVGLDDSRNKVDFSDATLIMNKGYNKIGKLVLVETYLPESVKAEEEFVEDEHPRDGDGKFSNKGQKSGKKTKAQKRKEYDEQEKFMDKKPEKLTSEQQYEQLLDAFGGDRKELVGKSWLLPTGQVIQPDRARDDGGKYAWHDNWIKSTGCDDCIKIRADTTREFDPKGELAHLHISGIRSQRKEGISEKQLEMVIEFIEKWKLDSDDVQIDDDTDGVIREQINGRISGFSRNRSEFAQRIAQRNKMGEAFVEQEHPRDEDGKFTSKWEISTFVGGHEIPVTQREKDNWEKHTTEEQRKDSNFKTMYGDKLKEKARGKGWDESEDVKVEKEDVEKEDVEKEIVEPQPPEERPQGDNYRIKAMKNKLKKHLEVLEDGKQILKDKYGDSPNLESALQKMDIAIKQLKKEIDDVDTKKYRTELPNIPMGKNTHTNETDGFVYNKTKIKIDRKLEENMGLRQQLAVIQSAWNDLPDDVRDVVKILNLKMSRARGRTIQGGMYNDKKQEVVLNINERSTNTAHNFYHEIGHARWHDMERKQPEKIKKFEEQVRKINKAPTKYAESYKNAVDRENKFREKWSQKMKRSGQDEWDPERYAKNMKILDARANAVKNIFQNEIHSELNAYAMGEIEDEMIISGKDTLKSLLNAYKDLWGIGN